MGPFFLDLVLGILFITCLSISCVGILSFRYRREVGPFLLMISGIPGSFASVFLVLSRSGAFEVGPVPIVLLYIMTPILMLLSKLLWRSHK